MTDVTLKGVPVLGVGDVHVFLLDTANGGFQTVNLLTDEAHL